LRQVRASQLIVQPLDTVSYLKSLYENKLDPTYVLYIDTVTLGQLNQGV